MTDAAAESNQTAYVAVGTWHEYLLTGDRAFLATMWPVVRRAIGFISFLNQYGPALIERLDEELPLDLGHHWIVTI